ncbi:MAG: hypothetical protein MUF30_06005 [Burkholderiales bacterium]|jgi:hypothetical protein|nr:hypothetical protein [Burkholderiales bacterium]
MTPMPRGPRPTALPHAAVVFGLLLAAIVALHTPRVHAADRAALVVAWVDAQRLVRLPMLLERALPFVVRVAFDRRFAEVGAERGFGADWNPTTPERDAADARADALVYEMVGTLEAIPSVDEATTLLSPLEDDDVAALVAFQRSETARRVVAKNDRNLATLLLAGLGEGALAPARQAELVELLADLGEQDESPALAPGDMRAIVAITQRPGVQAVMQAQVQRLLRTLGPEPRQRVEARIEAEVAQAVAAYVARTGR